MVLQVSHATGIASGCGTYACGRDGVAVHGAAGAVRPAIMSPAACSPCYGALLSAVENQGRVFTFSNLLAVVWACMAPAANWHATRDYFGVSSSVTCSSSPNCRCSCSITYTCTISHCSWHELTWCTCQQSSKYQMQAYALKLAVFQT